MMGLLGDVVRGFSAGVAAQNEQILDGTVDAMLDSIKNGSPLTGAPGQPSESGKLRDSWERSSSSPTQAEIATDSPWAVQNEEGVRGDGKPYIQHSSVGGRHSASLTVANSPAIVDAVSATVAGHSR